VRPPKNSWPETDGSRGILFFAQLMSEMLTAATFESFRVYSLDTNARLKEALQLCEDVRRQRVPRAVLKPIFEELDWSFGKDSASSALASAEIASFVKILTDRNDFSIESTVSHIKLILRLIGPSYKSELEKLILGKFDQPNQKIEIRKLVGFYCSHLINLGYSRHYVLQVVNLSFFSEPIRRIGRSTLSKFFRKFDGRIRRFIVLAAVTRDLGGYLQRLGYKIRDLAALSQDQRTTLAENANFDSTPFALELPTARLDPHEAMDYCYQMLSAQRAISYLDPYGMQVEWGDTMHVTRLRALEGAAFKKTDFLVTTRRPSSPGRTVRPKSISNYAKNIIQNFNEHSTERLLSSIRTAALARSSLSPENQLISLWSAIEVLLSEPRDEARIVHYASLIVPCIVSRHTMRQVSAIYEELLIGHRRRFDRLIRAMPNLSNVPRYRAFADLMFLPEHAARRTQLTEALSANPLALHRVWKLQNDYKDLKSASRTIADHADRVRWQIHRIYRARNQLVHAGRMPSYLESVILNLAEYYRSSIATIVRRAKQDHGESDIDQTVAEIGINYNIFRHTFGSKPNGALTPEHVSMLMD
jgi:hypothetical protein